MMVGEKQYTKITEAGKALTEKCKNPAFFGKKIGSYYGLDLYSVCDKGLIKHEIRIKGAGALVYTL